MSLLIGAILLAIWLWAYLVDFGGRWIHLLLLAAAALALYEALRAGLAPT